MFDFIPGLMIEASKIMLSVHGFDSITSKEGEANFVTEYDVAVQDFLYAEIGEHLPGAVMIGEESDSNNTKKINSGLCVIIDPIDGTTNFMHNYKKSAISVGIADCGKMVFGAVYDPYLEILYYAEKGCGAFMLEKGRKEELLVSKRPLSDALTCFGTSPYYREELGQITIEAAGRMFMNTRDLRRSGSAALDLCTVASGAVDIFFEYRLSPWDFAAGSLIIEEAGGVITTIDGKELSLSKPCSVLAGNPIAYREEAERRILPRLN